MVLITVRALIVCCMCVLFSRLGGVVCSSKLYLFSTDLWLSVSLVDWKKERWFYFLNAKTVNISLSRMKNVCEEQTFSLEVRMLPMSEHLGFIPCCGS